MTTATKQTTKPTAKDSTKKPPLDYAAVDTPPRASRMQTFAWFVASFAIGLLVGAVGSAL